MFIPWTKSCTSYILHLSSIFLFEKFFFKVNFQCIWLQRFFRKFFKQTLAQKGMFSSGKLRSLAEKLDQEKYSYSFQELHQPTSYTTLSSIAEWAFPMKFLHRSSYLYQDSWYRQFLRKTNALNFKDSGTFK